MAKANDCKDQLTEIFTLEHKARPSRTFPKITLVDYVEGQFAEDWGQGESEYGRKAQVRMETLLR
jgi:hypothetical protein